MFKVSIFLLSLFLSVPFLKAQTNIKNLAAAGTIAPDAVQLEVEDMSDFFGGFAVIKKGTEEALINQKGEIIIPYGQMNFKSNSHAVNVPIGTYLFPKNSYGTFMRFRHDLAKTAVIPFVEIKTEREGYLSIAGEKVYRTTTVYKDPYNLTGKYPHWLDAYDEEGYRNFFDYTGLFKDDGLLISEYYDGTYIKGRGNYQKSAKPTEAPKRINYQLEEYGWASDGYSIPWLRAGSQWTNGLRPASLLSSNTIERENDPVKKLDRENNRVGYINRKGEFQIKPSFYSAGEFSEEIAFVSKKDQFGKLLWGGIDTTGKLVIPYQYRFHPGRFSYGLAIIKAIDVPGTDYAFINKKGEIVFIIPKNAGDTTSIGLTDVNDENEFMYSFDYFHFVEGHQFVTLYLKERKGSNPGMVYLMDTLGHYTPVQQRLLDQLPAKGSVAVIPEIKNGKFLFKYTRALYADGYENKEAETEAFGIADLEGNILIPPKFYSLTLFEPGSKLQYARLGKTPTYSAVSTEGYIDENGVFRMVKVKPKGGF